MSQPLPAEVITLLGDPETVKILGTVSLEGIPHVVSKGSIHAGADGNIHLLQVLEHSQSNRNLTHSIWFDRKVTIYLRGKQGISYQIKGRPLRNIIAGPLFEEHYTKLRARLGDVDLAGVWIIEPDEVINETGAFRQAEEAERTPYLLHLDRLAKQA